MRTLHPHQELALAQLRESLRSGHRRPLIQSPTGSGKTVLAAAIVEGALAKGKRVIFTVPKLSLIDQTVEGSTKTAFKPLAWFKGSTLTQTALSRFRSVRSKRYAGGSCLRPISSSMDEAHEVHDFYRTWMGHAGVAEHPIRWLDGHPLDQGSRQAVRRPDCPDHDGRDDRQGLSSQFKVFAPSHPDLRGVKTVAGDYHEGQLSAIMSEAKLTADIVKTWLEKGEDRATLAFCVDLAHARKLQEQFQAAGVQCGYVDAYTTRTERKHIADLVCSQAATSGLLCWYTHNRHRLGC